jgi:hypothetical protein
MKTAGCAVQACRAAMTATPASAAKPGRAEARVELERQFLSSVLAGADDGDIREAAARYGISWRNFRDKRHRAIWRALEALDLRGVGERMDILLEEAGDDPGMGEPGSAARKRFTDSLVERSRGLAWLERELEAAGALALAGGKKYLRETAAAWAVPQSAGGLAKRLGFAQGRRAREA